MKKVKRLIEIKRQIGLAETRMARAKKKCGHLLEERVKILSSLTTDEKRLYKDRIETACK